MKTVGELISELSKYDLDLPIFGKIKDQHSVEILRICAYEDGNKKAKMVAVIVDNNPPEGVILL